MAPSSRSVEIAQTRRVLIGIRLVSIENESAKSAFVPAQGLGFTPAQHISERSLFVGVGDMASRPRDLADRMARRRSTLSDGFVRETFSLPREEARNKARDFL